MWTKLAATSVTSFYRAVVFALERRRLQLGWPMRMIDGRDLMASIGTLNGFSETRERDLPPCLQQRKITNSLPARMNRDPF
jgi:hypothetical protein